MRFPRQEYWSGVPFLTPGDLSRPEIKPQSPVSPALAGRFFTTMPPGKPLVALNSLACAQAPQQGLRYKDDGAFYQGLTISPVLTDIQADKNIVCCLCFFLLGTLIADRAEGKKCRATESSGGGGVVAKSCPTLATPWTVARQAPLSMRFSRQEDWSGLPFLSPWNLPYSGIEPGSCIAGRFFTD